MIQFDQRTSTQVFPDMQYRIYLKFTNRLCPHDFVNETFANAASGEYLTDLIYDQHIGPDELFAEIEGVSLQTIMFLSDNNCNEYFAQFFVPLTGPHRLKIIRTRGKFTGALENEGEFPLMQFEVFLDVKLDEPLYKTYYLCPRKENTFEDGFWSVLRGLSPFTTGGHVTIESELEIESRDLPLTSHIEISTGLAQDKCSRKIDRFQWNNSMCDLSAVSGEAGFIGIDRSSEILTRRSIIFVGDSHMRGLADTFLRLSCDLKRKTNIYKKDITSTGEDVKVQMFQIDHDEPYCQSLTVGYLPLMRCEQAMVEKLVGFNFAVINCGHHPASKLHYTYTKYHRVVRELLDSVHAKKLASEGLKTWPQVMWLDLTAQPLRQDRYVIVKQDWRTYHRLMLYRAIAYKELTGIAPSSKYPKEVKMDIIPAFSSTLTMFDKMCDNAHYPSDAKIPQVQHLLHKLSTYVSLYGEDMLSGYKPGGG